MVGKVPHGGTTLRGTANGKIVDPTPKAKARRARRAKKIEVRQADELRRLWR